MSADPNGTRWSKSAKNFGKQLLEKAGWSEGSGLGKEQSGSVTHVKVSRKDDVMGIGYVAGVQETWTTQSVGFADVLQRIKSKVKNTEDSEISTNGHSEPEEESFIFSLSDSQSECSSVNSPTSPVESRHFRRYAKRNALKTELLREQDERKKNEILGNHSHTKEDNRYEQRHKPSRHKRHRENKDDNDEIDQDDKSEKGNKEHHTESKKIETKNHAHDAVKSTHASNYRGNNVNSESEDDLMTLRSPVLRRLMVRCKEHEPKNTSFDTNDEYESRKDATKTNITTSSSSVSVSRVVVTKPNPRPPKCTVTPFHIHESEQQ